MVIMKRSMITNMKKNYHLIFKKLFREQRLIRYYKHLKKIVYILNKDKVKMRRNNLCKIYWVGAYSIFKGIFKNFGDAFFTP